jgi:hypothetical protein
MSTPGEACVKCGGGSLLRPSGDRVCNHCGYAWTIGEIRTESPKP